MKLLFRIMPFVIMIFLTVSCDWDSSLEMQAVSGDLSRSVSKNTKAQVIKLLDESNPATRWPENPFEEMPSLTKPYKQGKLSDEAINAALDRLNALRQMAGIPPVTSDPDWNDWCQYGAVVAGINNRISHGGYSEPSDDKDFLSKGNASTGLSNLVMGSNAAEKMDSFQDDSGNWGTNLGHRMLQFTPTLAAIGIGASSPGATVEYCYENYAGVGGRKDYKQKSFDWNFVSWPSPGAFPVRFGAWRTQTPGFWHIQVNTAKYSALSSDEVTVTLTRKHDGKIWKFDVSQIPNTYKVTGGVLFFYHNDGYNDGDIVQVKVQGLKDKDGFPAADIIFNVEFFDYTPRSTR